MAHRIKATPEHPFGISVALTVEEEAQLVIDKEQAVIDAQATKDAEAAAAAKKASGKQKLKDLGLDDDEIKQLTGA